MKQETTKKDSLGSFKGDSKIFGDDVTGYVFYTNKWRKFSGELVRFS